MTDNVNHPGHYCQGGVECIDALVAATTDLTGMDAVCTANAIKYLWRWKRKNGVEDLRKAQWYISRLIAYNSCLRDPTTGGNQMRSDSIGKSIQGPDGRACHRQNLQDGTDEKTAFQESHIDTGRSVRLSDSGGISTERGEIMTAKEYLSRIRRQNQIVKQVEKELAAVKADIVSLKAASLAEKVSGSRHADLADSYIRLEKYFDKVNAEWDVLIDMREEAKTMIRALPDEHQQAVLYARYINCDRWETIAFDMHYSWRGIFGLHGEALKAFERVHRSALLKGV